MVCDPSGTKPTCATAPPARVIPMKNVTVCLSVTCVRTRQAVIVGPVASRCTLVPS